MSQPLLLDEMFSDDIARQLRAKGYDAISVVADSALIGLADDQVLAYATTGGRALVTANIKDFVPLDGRYRAAGLSHAGLILVSTETFPQNRGFPSSITSALAALLGGTAKLQSGHVLFLTRSLVMRILVTGHRGRVGVPVTEFLRSRGHDVAGFDRADGADILDLAAVSRAARGCDAVVHMAALANDTAGRPEQIMAVNVLGTWHVLLAAEAAGAARVICFSSAQALGIAEGERLPDYFPVDDAHRRRAMRPYGLSKRLAEDMCDGFTARTGIATVAFRPVGVWYEEDYAKFRDRRRSDPRSEWEPYWEYGAFVDVRDVADAVDRALTVPLAGHHRMLLCAADISATAPSLELAARLAPDVPVTDPARYRADPWAALIDCSAAATTLGWRPAYRWGPPTAGRRR